MYIKSAINQSKKLFDHLTSNRWDEVLETLQLLANDVTASISSDNLWDNEALAKFNVIMKYILIAVENRDDAFAASVVKNDLQLLLTNVLMNDKGRDVVKDVDDVTQDIKEQYTDFMYPNIWKGIIPEDLSCDGRVFSPLYNLEYIQHNTFRKYIPLDKLNVLIAGCGTGESAISCALAHPETSFVFVDISPASLKMTKMYVQELKLKNVEIQQADIMTMKLDQKFDIIISTGVIHHLSEPARGVANLKEHLKEHGSMAIMVYGEYGRFEIGLFQEVLKIIMKDNFNFEKGVDIVQKLVAEVDPSDRLANFAWKQDIYKGKQHIVDLLLNVNENRYNVKRLESMMQTGGMKLLEFTTKSTFNPENYVKEEATKKLFENLTYMERCQIAEMINGKMSKHSYYAIKNENNYKRLSVYDQEASRYIIHKSPYIVESKVSKFGQIFNYVNLDPIAMDELNLGDYKNSQLEGLALDVMMLCDGKRKISQVFDHFKGRLNVEKVNEFLQAMVDKKILFLHDYI